MRPARVVKKNVEKETQRPPHLVKNIQYLVKKATNVAKKNFVGEKNPSCSIGVCGVRAWSLQFAICNGVRAWSLQ